MATSVTIEEFHALLTSEKENNPLLEALRKLTTIEAPERIRLLKADEMVEWTGWAEV